MDPPLGLVVYCRNEWPRLVGALTLYTGDRELAQEIAQETLARVSADWTRVSALDAPGAWAHRVALNLARSHFRRLRVARGAQARLAGSPGDVHTSSDVADAIAVRDAVRALPERQRRALVLRYFSDLSVAEVATMMKCPEGTVKTLTARAIAALRGVGLFDDEAEVESATDAEQEAPQSEGLLDA